MRDGTRVAIACEGGGSHTAFTAGVLQRLLRTRIKIAALSGISGGAVCATLVWRGLLEEDRDEATRHLSAFWRDNAVLGMTAMLDAALLWGARAAGEVFSPELSPYWSPGDARKPFRRLLERHGGFEEVPRLLQANPAAPRLLLSAADVRQGQFTVFRSHPVTHRGTVYAATRITADVVVASAAVPTLFRAVHRRL